MCNAINVDTWFKVKDNKPPVSRYFTDSNGNAYNEDHPILTYCNDGKYRIAVYEQWDEESKPEWHECCSGHWNISNKVLFWKDLPEKPVLKDENE